MKDNRKKKNTDKTKRVAGGERGLATRGENTSSYKMVRERTGCLIPQPTNDSEG